MKRKHLERAARQAIALAAELDARLPACCAVAPEDLFAAMWPTAIGLERLERQAAKNRRKARGHRKAVRRARRQVSVLLASQPEALASLPVLRRTVPFSPDLWRVSLVSGSPVPAPEREAA